MKQGIDAAHVASLAHLRFGEEELEQMQQLLDSFAQFSQVLPDDAQGAFKMGCEECDCVLREDVAKQCEDDVCESEHICVPLTVEGAQ